MIRTMQKLCTQGTAKHGVEKTGDALVELDSVTIICKICGKKYVKGYFADSAKVIQKIIRELNGEG